MFKQFLILMVATVMLFESLLPKGVGFSQASHLGDLYSHYQLHKSSGIGLGEFLWLHYSSDSNHKSNSEHKKLPSFESQLSFIVFELSQACVSEIKEKIVNFDLHQKHYNYSNLYNFQFQGSLLNPPRMA